MSILCVSGGHGQDIAGRWGFSSCLQGLSQVRCGMQPPACSCTAWWSPLPVTFPWPASPAMAPQVVSPQATPTWDRPPFGGLPSEAHGLQLPVNGAPQHFRGSVSRLTHHQALCSAVCFLDLLFLYFVHQLFVISVPGNNFLLFRSFSQTTLFTFPRRVS